MMWPLLIQSHSSCHCAGSGSKKRTRLTRPSIKLGCLARYQVVHREGSDLVTITYTEHRHINAAGELCHGKDVQDATAVTCHLSREAKATIAAHLAAGVPPARIIESESSSVPACCETCMLNMCFHLVGAVVQDGCIRGMLNGGFTREQAAAAMILGNNVPRDHGVTEQDIANVQKTLHDDQNNWQLDNDDATSVEAAMRKAPDTVFAYRRQVVKLGVQKVALALGFLSSFMLAALLAFGHGSPVIIDSTFATNKYMVSFVLYTACKAAA
jgi:hypothetical protein